MTRSLTCNEVRSHMAAYLDRQLTLQAYEMMDSHVRTCEGCRSEITALWKAQQKITELMHTHLNNVQAAPDAWDRLQERLRVRTDNSYLLGEALAAQPVPISMNGHRSRPAPAPQPLKPSFTFKALTYAFVTLVFVAFVGLVIVPTLMRRGLNEAVRSDATPTPTAEVMIEGTDQPTPMGVEASPTPMDSTPTPTSTPFPTETATLEVLLPPVTATVTATSNSVCEISLIAYAALDPLTG
jgi:hypothetical protein